MPATTVDHGVAIPAEDGTVLVADVVRPDGLGQYPTILMRTPYDRTAYASISLQAHSLRLAAAGYAVVLQDVRGRFASDGEFRPFVNEQRDGVATVDWITSRPWSDGVVAGAGASYNAMCQQAIATSKHPAYRAWVPALSPGDVRTTWIRTGGAFNYGFHLSWALSLLDSPPAVWSHPLSAAQRGPDDQPELEESRVGSFYFDWLAEQDPYPDAEVPRDDDFASVTAPALVVAGTYDVFFDGSMDLYRSLTKGGSVKHSLVAGPWDHAGLPLGRRSGDAVFDLSAQLDLSALQRQWYDFHLRGVGDEPPRARVFVSGRDEFVAFESWPPPTSKWRLEPEGEGSLVGSAEHSVASIELAEDDPTPTVGGRLFPWEPVMRPGSFDQSMLASRPDVLSFVSSPLVEPISVLGPATLEVTMESSEKGSDVVAILCDVGPDGAMWNLADGVRRMDWTEDAATLVVSLGHVSHEFRAGHRLALLICAGAFPRYDAFHLRGQRHFHLGSQRTVLTLPIEGHAPEL